MNEPHDPILHAGPGAFPAIDYAAAMRESLTHEEKLRLIRDGRPAEAAGVRLCPNCGHTLGRFDGPAADPSPRLSPADAQAERTGFLAAIASLLGIPAESLIRAKP
jgi:hypothetical protein